MSINSIIATCDNMPHYSKKYHHKGNTTRITWNTVPWYSLTYLTVPCTVNTIVHKYGNQRGPQYISM